MRAAALLVFLVLAGRAQLQFSKAYPTPPRSVPLQILNCSPSHFYFLRYNRIAHDLTIEKRRKSDGGIERFVPLKMDSVNASWFDYQDLDRLFFEKNGQIFLVFEHVLNSQSTIFMKRIDTLCRASGFVEISRLTADRSESHLSQDFGLDEKKNLVITRSRSAGSNTYKEVLVYDPSERKELARYKLPAENFHTGYSVEYSFDAENNMYYVLRKVPVTAELPHPAEVAAQLSMPDSLFLVSLRPGGGIRHKRYLPLQGPVFLHMLKCSVNAERLVLHFMYSASDLREEEKIYFAIWRFDHSLEDAGFRQQELQADLEKKLTYYDGSNNNSAARKSFAPLGTARGVNSGWHIAERRSGNFYKEVMVWQTTNVTDQILAQHLLPRKTFFFPDRVGTKTLGDILVEWQADTLYVLTLEHPANENAGTEYTYQDLARVETLSGASLALYRFAGRTQATKSTVYRNRDFSYVPVEYSGNRSDVVLYLQSTEQEKFATCELSRL